MREVDISLHIFGLLLVSNIVLFTDKWQDVIFIEGGESSSVTPTSHESHEAATAPTSQLPTPVPSDRDKSPSVISHITVNTRDLSDGDELSTQDDEVCTMLHGLMP